MPKGHPTSWTFTVVLEGEALKVVNEVAAANRRLGKKGLKMTRAEMISAYVNGSPEFRPEILRDLAVEHASEIEAKRLSASKAKLLRKMRASKTKEIAKLEAKLAKLRAS